MAVHEVSLVLLRRFFFHFCPEDNFLIERPVSRDLPAGTSRRDEEDPFLKICDLSLLIHHFLIYSSPTARPLLAS